MLTVIDPGAPADISGYVINEHIARLSRAALKRQPLQPVMEQIVKELGFDSFMYGMESAKNQRDVENRLRDALKYDRARVQLGKISRFGLMELSRQRLRPALAESAYLPCPRCHGIGHIRGTESTALHILRILQEEAMKDNTAQIVAQVPVDVATFLLNEKRADVQTIETRFKVNVLLVPNRHLETPNYSVTRLRHAQGAARGLERHHEPGSATGHGSLLDACHVRDL